MSDPITSARTARESLARGLNALQADPNVPPGLLEAAQPIAQAMGSLHQIERGGQVAAYAPTALAQVRAALGQLQAQPVQHPALAQAMEAVASSLGLVHALAQTHAAPAPPAANPALAATAMAPSPAFPQAAPAPLKLPGQAAPQPAAAPFQPAATAPAAQPVPPPPPNDYPIVEAPLGAHSPTNFYKGLSGNDIVDHGGLFVATYKIPKIGTNLRLKVSLPGGYEFEANAVVRWSRSDGGNDAPPGYGAQFTQIAPEARQLIYRYVRNREPLFHDDL